MSRSFALRPLLALSGGAATVIFYAAGPAAAAVTAASVVDYQPGAATSFTNPVASLGLPAGDTAFGALTPFNPPFRDDQIVIVGAGGRLTLRLSAPISAGGAGPEIGVFVNNGIVDISPDGSGTAGNPPSTFSPLPSAIVSVSADGQTFVQLSGGAFSFDNPTNFYTDVAIENYSAPLGAAAADFSRPFTGTLASLGGLTYPQIVQLLAGSGGGNWLDLSSAGLPNVEYVRFDVPAGGAGRLVLDAVTAVPEPSLVAIVFPALALLARHRRSR